MFPANCRSCLHVVCLCSTVADSSTDQLLKFQHSSVKTKVSKTTFKNGCQYCVHPVYPIIQYFPGYTQAVNTGSLDVKTNEQLCNEKLEKHKYTVYCMFV